MNPPITPEQLTANTLKNNLANYGTAPTLSVADLNNFKPTVIPPTTNDATSFNGLVASVGNQLTQAEQNLGTAQKDTSATTDEITKLLTSLGGQTADQLAAEQQVGLPTLNKDLLDLQNTARQQNIEYATTPYSLAGQGRGITTGILRGQEAVKQRQVGIDLLLTNSNILAKQGNIALAQSLADKAIAAKYDPIKNEIEAKKFILEQKSKTLTSAENKLQEAQKNKLSLQLKQIETQMQTEKDIQNLGITLSKNQAPQSIIDKLTKATSLNEAIKLASPYMVSLKDKADLNYTIAQTAKIYNDIKNDNNVSHIDPANSLAYAQEYAATGKIPTGLPKGSFGAIAQYAKELPKQKGEIVSTVTGVKPAQDSTYQDALASMSSARELAIQLKELDKKRIGGIVSGTLGKVFGSEDQQRYMDLRSQIVDLLARARSGAAINETELRQYEGMLPGRFSEPLGLGANSDVRIDNFINALSNDATQKASSKGWSIYGLSKVTFGGKEYTVGDVLTNDKGQTGRINSDGSITLIQ